MSVPPNNDFQRSGVMSNIAGSLTLADHQVLTASAFATSRGAIGGPTRDALFNEG
jgi:hypothetical protein